MNTLVISYMHLSNEHAQYQEAVQLLQVGESFTKNGLKFTKTFENAVDVEKVDEVVITHMHLSNEYAEYQEKAQQIAIGESFADGEKQFSKTFENLIVVQKLNQSN